MRKVKLTCQLWLLAVILIMATGCDDNNDTPATQTDQDLSASLTTTESAAADDTTSDTANINTWLQQVNNGEVTTTLDESFAWGLGYLVYYGPLETVGVDTLIYNALEAHKRMASGEATPNDQNLIDLTEGITFDPAVALTEQVAQTAEIRNAILARVVPTQQDLSPDEALASNEVVGFIAPAAPEAIGGKYLVYTQETPEVDFVFQGVAIATDATTQASGETYSFLGWENLPLLGDATGPFWNELPAGVSGDPANTDEGRPGVLLISQGAYEEMKAGNFR